MNALQRPAVVMLLAGCAGTACEAAHAAAGAGDGDWPMPAHGYASTRFSPLDGIDRGNVANLQVAFTFSIHNDAVPSRRDAMRSTPPMTELPEQDPRGGDPSAQTVPQP